ncbi:hypothetical protein ACTMTJ_44765 [Phytohabitans sp. LJ34]|uniref:hypothetical protein n=1 Tax=Phytohabitans sp. LJ34 TaxID=3452217 RepID=UPI003F8A9FAD
MGIRRTAIATTFAALITACGGPDGDPTPGGSATGAAPASATAGAPDRRSVDELASTAPIDLIVDLGPDGWTARYNRGAGIAVTPENWATAYEISARDAAAEIATAKKDGQLAAATEQWSTPDASTMRLTVRRYTSLARIKDAWWTKSIETGSTPRGILVPHGMRVACRSRPLTDANRPRDNFADCTVVIGDTTVVYLSRTGPSTDAAAAGTVEAVIRWLRAVKAPVD